MPDEIDLDTSHDLPRVEKTEGDPLTISDRSGSRAPAVPHGARLLHIGAPKTGTTAVQGAMDALSATVRSYGVAVPGTPNEQAHAALALLGQRVGWSQDPKAVSTNPWTRMVERMGIIRGTVFLSSEYLCEASGKDIERVTHDLGNVHAVLTLRPLEKVLPSAWQQYLKSGHRRTYEQWLHATLGPEPEQGVTPSFWRRHDQAAVAERWARGVGPGNMTVVVLPPHDRQALYRAFDDLLGLPEGTLASAPPQRSNRSMTAAEAELFRTVNVALRDTGLPWADYAHLMRYGAILRTVERPPASGAAPIETPDWALRRARERATAFAQRIERLRAEGLHVVGDLQDLSLGTPEAHPSPAVPQTVEVEVAAQALLGAIARATTGATYFESEGRLTAGRPGDVVPSIVNTPAGRLTSRELAALLARRVREGAERRLRRLRRLGH